MGSVLTPVIGFGIVILAFYFWGTGYLSVKNQQVLVTEVTSTLDSITRREAQLLDQEFTGISHLALMMQQDHQSYFNNDRCFFPNGKPQFGLHTNGVYYKTQDIGGSSLYYSSSTQMEQDQKRKALCSESMDPLLKQIVDHSPLVTQAYINTWDDMNRLYPFMEDAPGQYGPVLNMEEFNFYYLADQEHNPDRKPVWTEAYLDPAGQGWMISNIVPIYRKDGFLEGVSGLDVTLEVLIGKLMKVDLPWKSGVLLTGKTGDIIAMSDWTEAQFMAAITKGSQTSALPGGDKFNSSNSPFLMYSKKVGSLHEVDGVSEMVIGEKEYLIGRHIVPETEWNLYLLVDKQQLLIPLADISDFNTRIGWVMILVVLVVFSLLLVYLQRKSSELGVQVSKPIAELSTLTALLGTRLDVRKLGHVGIDEIDQLNDNFNELGEQLSAKTRELVDSITREKERMKEAIEFEKLAITDPLTGLYNRLKIEEVLAREVDRCCRSGETFGIILVDIDYFKRVNDTYGHQVGDQVLIEVARLLKTNVRQLDTPGRWGGEEFIVICPLSNLDGTFEIGNVLRSGIAVNSFSLPDPLTASMGVASYIHGEDLAELIERADKALYEAKNRGRNCVVRGKPSLRSEDGAFL